METKLIYQALNEVEADAVAVVLFEDGEGLPQAKTWLDEMRTSGEFTGKSGEMATLHQPQGLKAKRLIAVGGGKKDKFDAAVLRKAVGTVVRAVKQKGVKKLAWMLAGDNDTVTAEAAVEGAILGNYEPIMNKPSSDAKPLESFALVAPAHLAELEAGLKRGVILGEMKCTDDALESYDKVLTLDPRNAEALNNRGFLWWLNRQNWPKAIADLERAFALAPDLPYLRGLLLHLRMYAADWRNFAEQKTAIAQGIRAGRQAARPFMFQAVSDRPEELQACARLYARDQFPPSVNAAPHMPAERRGREKIRLGYLSGEFRDQATAILMAGLYERHDRGRFEVIAVDNGSADESTMSARLKQAFDQWIDIGGLRDIEAAETIRAAGIDILVNLNGYFGKLRMDVFAQRPAPLQVNYLGFPGTLGAPYMDYIIADRIIIPPDEQRFYDEQVVILPGSYQINDDRGRPIAARPSRLQAGLPERGFVFCNFNQSYKLTPEIFVSWMRILAKVDDSVLWLLEGPAPYAGNIARHAEAHGVAPARILFAPDRPPDQHLARLSLADLFLDSLPYNAHTTGSDALWAGVPVLTRRGTAFPGRVAASLLHAAGLPELVTESVEDYEKLAVRLATDKNAFAAVKTKLTRNCPLFDTDLFRRNIERAYLRMWEIWLAGEKPRAFDL